MLTALQARLQLKSEWDHDYYGKYHKSRANNPHMLSLRISESPIGFNGDWSLSNSFTGQHAVTLNTQRLDFANTSAFLFFQSETLDPCHVDNEIEAFNGVKIFPRKFREKPQRTWWPPRYSSAIFFSQQFFSLRFTSAHPLGDKRNFVHDFLFYIQSKQKISFIKWSN